MKLQSAARSMVRIAVAGFAAISLSGCDVMVGMGGFGGKELAKDQWKKSYPLAPGGQLEIANINGAIETEATDGSTVEVVADRTARATTPEAAKDLLQKIEMREQVSPDRVSIEVKLPSGFRMGNAEVGFVVKVPKTALLRLSNTNGKILVTGSAGAVRADVTNGSVTGRGLTGAVNASSTNGSVSIDLDAVARDGIKLGTTNGGIQLMLPAAAQAEINASCANGTVATSNLSLESRGTQSRRRIDATLNGGGAPIDLETTNGGIKITGK
jgi:hypothetical protein